MEVMHSPEMPLKESLVMTAFGTSGFGRMKCCHVTCAPTEQVPVSVDNCRERSAVCSKEF